MKKLNCCKCKNYLGEINKGRIKNGTAIYCKSCHSKVVANEIRPKENVSDMFAKMFSGGRYD